MIEQHRFYLSIIYFSMDKLYLRCIITNVNIIKLYLPQWINRYTIVNNTIIIISCNIAEPNYTGWLVTGGTSGKGVILREKRSQKYRIKFFV